MIFKCKIIKMKIVPKKSFLLLQSENNLGSSDGWLCWQGGSIKKRRRNHLLQAMSFKKRLGINKGVIWLFWLPHCSGDDRPSLRPQFLLGTSEGEGTKRNIWWGSKCSMYASCKTNYLAFNTQQSSHTQAEHMQPSEKQITSLHPRAGECFQ